VLDRALRDLGLDKGLKAAQIFASWSQLVGPAVAKIASPGRFRNRTLFIDVADHLWMQELQFQERELLERLNQRLGEPLVSRLFLQLTRTPVATAEQPVEEASPADVKAPLDPQLLDPQQEEELARDVAGVRDPQLREVLKDFRRRLLQARPPV
jgi:predicted nucleic acid-binding Zn ribbon protein